MTGYSKAELDDVQHRWGFRFPPDLVQIYLHRRQVVSGAHDWSATPRREIRDLIDFPVHKFLDDVRRRDWWPEWGDRPHNDDDAVEFVRNLIGSAPKLIPICGHRCIPETPHESGNPVFSVWGSDIITYGANLRDYIAREAHRQHGDWPKVKRIPFWSRAVDVNNGELWPPPSASRRQ